MLGRDVDPSEYGRLELFPVARPVRVTFSTDELQALCPAVDGVQPDIYSVDIQFTARTHAIESKSLKLWLTTFRERRIFAEDLTIEMYDAIEALGPALADIRIRLSQNVRGGIRTVVEHPPPAS